MHTQSHTGHADEQFPTDTTGLELAREPETVAEFGLALVDRYAGGAEAAKDAFREQAKKRVGLTFRPTRVVSWDHRKLGGTY